VTAGQAPAVQPTPAPTQAPQAGTHPRFSSCAEAARNGYRGPYVRGINPEYAWYQDRDKDGVVCE
jgi:micrococcal nuclease